MGATSLGTWREYREAQDKLAMLRVAHANNLVTVTELEFQIATVEHLRQLIETQRAA
jgi:hypothetical protein